MNLVEFLRARLDMEAEIAREATPGPWQNAPTARHHPTASGRSEEAVFASPPDTGAMVVAVTGEAGERRNLVNAEHIARWDPARALAEVDAKRKLIERYERAVRVGGSSPSGFSRGQDDGYEQACLDVIRDAAEVYADHPDYDEAWRP